MSLEVSLASSYRELCGAFSLVHDRYVDFGYMKPHKSAMRYGPLQLLPFSRTFVSKCKGRVVGTASVVLDSDAGLPSDSLFNLKYAQLRKAGRRIAEGTLFACSAKVGPRGQLLNLALLRSVFRWCIAHHVDSICVAVNPKHLFFYTRMLGFVELSNHGRCSYVNGAAAHLLHFDLKGFLEGSVEVTPTAQKYFEYRDSDESCFSVGYNLPAEDAAALISLRPEILKEMNRAQLRLFVETYGFFFLLRIHSDFAASICSRFADYAMSHLNIGMNRQHAVHEF